MWHLREVSDDKISLDILPESECELGLMSAECCIFEDFLDSNGVTFFIRNFDTDETESRDWCLDTDTLGLECEREVFFESFDLRESHSL